MLYNFLDFYSVAVVASFSRFKFWFKFLTKMSEQYLQPPPRSFVRLRM